MFCADSTIKSCSNQFLPDFQESLSQSLLDKLNKFSFAEERILRNVTIRKSPTGNLGLQITEGSDGKVYVQSVIFGGPAYLTGDIKTGDQIIAVNGHNIQMLKYEDALNVLKNNTGNSVKFLLSRLCDNNNNADSKLSRNNINKYKRLSSYQCNYNNNHHNHNNNNNMDDDNNQIEKHVIENCRDLLNIEKYHKNITEVPYLKHIRYNEIDNIIENKFININNKINNISNSCTEMDVNNRAIIVDMIPKRSHLVENNFNNDIDTTKELLMRPITLPRSLGLSRKWRGPVKYPVTPIKKVGNNDNDFDGGGGTTSDEEQVFI